MPRDHVAQQFFLPIHAHRRLSNIRSFVGLKFHEFIPKRRNGLRKRRGFPVESRTDKCREHARRNAFPRYVGKHAVHLPVVFIHVGKISADIDRLEDLSAKIFAQVKSDPSKLPQIRKFMDYYLPTTLKLLNAYDRMGAQGVSGENIDATMQRVESMMGTIVTAFEKQLDMLFGSEAMDISTDITVLENMMKREGLSEDDGELHAESGTATASQDDIKLEL